MGPYPTGVPIVDPSNNMDGTGGIDDTLAHFYDAQLRATSADYPLLNVACGTYAVFLYAETEKSMPTRAPYTIPAGGRLSKYIQHLDSPTLDAVTAANLNASIEKETVQVMQNVLEGSATTLRDIAQRASWSTDVVVDNTCRLNYPEIATDPMRQVKDPNASNFIETVVFSGGVSQKMNLAARAEEWRQLHKQELPSGTELTFKLGDINSPYTGAAAYVLDRIINQHPDQRVFKPKFPNQRY